MPAQTRKPKAKTSRLTKVLLETANDMRASGLLTNSAHDKITMRHRTDMPAATPMSGAEIKLLRENANLSQAVFAQLLNLTAGYVSQLERGAKRPTGSTLALLNVIQRKGVRAIL